MRLFIAKDKKKKKKLYRKEEERLFLGTVVQILFHS